MYFLSLSGYLSIVRQKFSWGMRWIALSMATSSSCSVCRHCPANKLLSLAKIQWSGGLKSGEYLGWGTWVMFICLMKHWTWSQVCAGALSCRMAQVWSCQTTGRWHQTCSLKFLSTCRYTRPPIPRPLGKNSQWTTPYWSKNRTSISFWVDCSMRGFCGHGSVCQWIHYELDTLLPGSQQ